MNDKLCDVLFNFKIANNMKINCNNREMYSQMICYLNDNYTHDLIILVPSINEANVIYNSLNNYLDNVYLFLEDEYLTKKALSVSPEFTFSRLQFLNEFENNKKRILITDINGFMKKLPNKTKYREKYLSIKQKETIKRDKIIKKLLDIGYEKTSLVTEVGEFAIRGFVIDIFPVNSLIPYRIELFDDEIEQIREFEVETQRSIKEKKEIIIKPAKDEYSESFSNIINYLENPFLIIQDENEIYKAQENINIQKKYYEDDELYDYKKHTSEKKLFVNVLDYFVDSNINVEVKNIVDKLDSIDNFITFVKEKKEKIYFFSNNIKIINKIKELNLNIYKFVFHGLNTSLFVNNNYYISDKDIFPINNNTNFKSISKIQNTKKITDLKNIKIGDYVVHKVYGIGIYGGIVTIEKNNVKKDYLLIKYKGTDKLYLPVSSMTSLYKYSSKEGKKPKIYKLNSLEWEKTKFKIKKKISDISKQLIEVSKERNKIKIEPMNIVFPEESVFANEFEYVETIDQIKAIKEIEEDLKSDKPMDRLLCGDVGYGKTEVIFRAMFKVIMHGKQVVYLCPTTLLSNQQYNSALERFKNFHLNIELLNRYTSEKDAKRIINDLKTGKTDIVFGTHKLFNEKIIYKELGLLIIDEEHKFGVEHKEKIKKIKNSVHVLSVSATPIPRSLQMSLVGVRNLSLIETAPLNRFPVQTYVINYNELLIKEALEKEISRQGQSFVLYNNINGMEVVLKKLKALIPNATIAYAHGQLSKEQSEQTMKDFVEKKIDVLLTTTIIENGVDIPNANTIIVLNAQNFGLSQLYQIRGRVGRSDRIAYAYFMYNSSQILNELSRKRLEAIKEFTELGSGYKLSMRDLSIRGAGDILGKEQAGFIDSVGIDLYLELVNEELNNKPVEVENNINIDDVQTHIDKTYSDDDDIIIELHNKINAINDINDYKIISREIKDRFGCLDNTLERYLEQELLESSLNKLNIKIMKNDKYKVSLILKEDLYKKLIIEDLFVETTKLSSKFNFEYRGNNIIITLNKLNLDEDFLKLLNKLLLYIIKSI